MADSWSPVTLATVALISAATLALLGACLFVVGRECARASAARRGVSLLWLLTLFLVVFSAKLLLMRSNPVTAPYWDQWDAEGLRLFIPFYDGSLTWSQMFALHNEHRVFFTRLLALDLLVVNGQWDPRLEQVANAGMHSLVAVLVAATCWLAGGGRRLPLLVFACVITFAMPFAWDNTLGGFQSAFYFLLLFSIPALWLTTRYPPASAPWLAGWLCAVAALFTSAGGVTVSMAIAAMMALLLLNNWREWRHPLITLCVAVAVGLLGAMVASPPIDGHEPLRAHTAAEFAMAFARSVAWPWVRRPELGLVMWAPIGLLLVHVVRRRGRTTEGERWLLGVAGWVVLNAVAVSYARGAAGAGPAIRYMDFLSLGVVINAAALTAWFAGSNGHAKIYAKAAIAGWVACAVVGVGMVTNRSLTDLALWRHYYASQSANVRQFMVSDDLARFVPKKPMQELPYPDAATLAGFLRHPVIREILPAAVRAPIDLQPNAITNEAFALRGIPTGTSAEPGAVIWGSYSGQGDRSEGRFESRPMPACRSGDYLRLPVSGSLGALRHSLVVNDIETGRAFPVVPSYIPPDRWVGTIIPCPEHSFTLTAVDAEAQSWFAFGQPVEVGRLSLNAERVIAWSRQLFVLSLLTAALAAAIPVLSSRPPNL